MKIELLSNSHAYTVIVIEHLYSTTYDSEASQPKSVLSLNLR